MHGLSPPLHTEFSETAIRVDVRLAGTGLHIKGLSHTARAEVRTSATLTHFSSRISCHFRGEPPRDIIVKAEISKHIRVQNGYDVSVSRFCNSVAAGQLHRHGYRLDRLRLAGITNVRSISCGQATSPSSD
jgi:hypothetical protein